MSSPTYLGGEYRLRPMTPEFYEGAVIEVSYRQKDNGLRKTLKKALQREDHNLIDMVYGNADNLQSAYGEGGGYYMLAFGVGITALRKTNPLKHVPSIGGAEWDSAVVGREQELRTRPGITTVEAANSVGLSEIAEVNPGYIEGYQATMITPNLVQLIGFSGLGTMHAHDMLHFASLKK